MKKQGVVWIAVLLLAGSAWGQYGYLYQSGGWMFGADFIGQEGWMVGAGGAILHTQDGGRNWVFQRNIGVTYPSFSVPLNDVVFKTPRNGWICTDGFQTVLRTTDGGQFWTPESLPVYGLYGSKMSFGDTLRGWLVGGYGSSSGRIIATTDGGQTWVIQSQNHPYFGVFALSPSQCWAVGGLGWTARTTDGGQNWVEQQLSPNNDLNDVFFTDTLFGWACGYGGSIRRTTDGGLSWGQQTSGTSWELTALAFLDRSRGFAVGDSGTLIKTTNGGASWSTVATGVTATFFDLTFGDSLHGWAIGVEGGVILATSDGGTTWRLIQQGPAGHATTERLQAITFADSATGWAASWEGNIWHTLDGGKIWSKQYSVSPKKLLGLAMANANTGWAVGDSGMILKTQDGGATWISQRRGYYSPLSNVFASDAQNAWAGGVWQPYFRTSNGGASWDSLWLMFPSSAAKGLASVDTLYGWVLFDDGSVWATTNSGRTWGPRRRSGPVFPSWQHLSFVDSVWGWALPQTGIVRSTDGGVNWQIQNNSNALKDISGATRMKAWAVGDNGVILATTDGGANWVSQTAPITPNLLAVTFADTLHGIAGGNGDLILVTQNGGALWDTVRVGNGGTKDIFLIDTLYGWLAGSDGNARRTTNGGRTWQTLLTKTDLAAVHFANRNFGWVARQYYNIWKTTDGGATWDSLAILRGPGGINDGAYDIRVLNDRIGWCAIGSYSSPGTYSGTLKATMDHGSNWAVYSRMNAYSINFGPTGSPINSTSACFVGPGGRMAMRVRGDLTWELAPIVLDTLPYWPRPLPSLWNLKFADSRTGWAVGQRGARTMTTDGGVSWRLQAIDTSRGPFDSARDSLLVSVQVFNPLTVRAIGYLGRSVLTTDGGMSWMNEETGTDEWLLTSSFLSPTLGWVAGENGMVLKYGLLPSGVEAERGGTTAPLYTALEQNHPNPFAGHTQIRYQLGHRGQVGLEIFNVLGQSVRRLVNEVQKPGAYAVSWDGKDGAGNTVSSGIYFYRLETQAKSQTRKMVKVR